MASIGSLIGEEALAALKASIKVSSGTEAKAATRAAVANGEKTEVGAWLANKERIRPSESSIPEYMGETIATGREAAAKAPFGNVPKYTKSADGTLSKVGGGQEAALGGEMETATAPSGTVFKNAPVTHPAFANAPKYTKTANGITPATDWDEVYSSMAKNNGAGSGMHERSEAFYHQKQSRVQSSPSDVNGMGEAIHPEAQGYIDAATAPVTPAGPKSLERLKFEKLGISKGEDYKMGRLQGKYNAHYDALESEAGRNAVGADIGVDGSKLSKEEMQGKVHSYYGDQVKEKASTMDHMWGNKVPQKAAGGLITAGVVGSLFSNRGQQSNSQLYGQSAAPGQ